MTDATLTTPRTLSGVRFLLRLLCLSQILIFGCRPKPESQKIILAGKTMGTTYSVTISEAPPWVNEQSLQGHIDDVLLKVNQQMSNWIEDSEVSLFNASESTQWFDVSPATAEVISEAIRIHQETSGAFDVTLAPLIDAWGFGPGGRDTKPPTEAELQQLKAVIGSEKLESRKQPPAIRKTVAGVTVNLSAIAKGYGVDVVAEELLAEGFTDFLVEIGGEVRVSGHKQNRTNWRIGIERPEITTRKLQTFVALTNLAMATSGDYRNFVEIDGQKYSHTIDPVTMKPINHALASVTVLAETCLEADALATSLMVMGPEKGYDWAEEQHLPVLMLMHAEDDFVEKATPEWTQIVGDVP